MKKTNKKRDEIFLLVQIFCEMNIIFISRMKKMYHNNSSDAIDKRIVIKQKSKDMN